MGVGVLISGVYLTKMEKAAAVPPRAGGGARRRAARPRAARRVAAPAGPAVSACR